MSTVCHKATGLCASAQVGNALLYREKDPLESAPKSRNAFGHAVRCSVLLLAIDCAQGWAQPYLISTIVGGVGPATPAPGAAASIGAVNGIATDAAGNVYFSSAYPCVFKLDATGTVRRYAGTCRPGYSGDGGPAVSAQLYNPGGLATDSAGNLYIADAYPLQKIRKVSPSGIITTVAGVEMNRPPVNIAADASGNLYIPTEAGNSIVEVTAATGTVTTVAGSESSGPGGFSGDGGPATSAQLNDPTGVAVDAAGNLYIADTLNYRVRKVSATGTISTIACNGTLGYPSGDGGPAAAAVCWPTAVTVDSSGNLYITDEEYSVVRKVSTNGVITTVAGVLNPQRAFGFSGDGGPATSAGLNQPFATALDPAGNLYIADQANYRVRKVSTSGIITTVAGNGTGFSGDGGPAANAQLYFSGSDTGISVDSSGNLYIADSGNNRIRTVTADGLISTIAGSGVATPPLTFYPNQAAPGDGGPAISAPLSSPASVAVDSAATVYIADGGIFRVRKVSPDGIITTIAGNGESGFSGDGGPATNAELALPFGLALDSAGNVYFSDISNVRIRKVSPGGIITTVAGNGTSGYSGDGGPATSAQFIQPTYVAVDSKDNLYISDLFACAVRKVTPAGIISTYAGGLCNPLNFGDNGVPALGATIYPGGIAFDSADNLYIANASSIYKVSAESGILTFVAGAQVFGFSGDGGLASDAGFAGIGALAIDSAGRIFVQDVNAVRVLIPDLPANLSISGGNNQRGAPGTVLPNPLQVTLTGSAGVPPPGVSVNFTVTSGSAKLSTASVLTDGSGQASVSVTLAATAGPVMVTASVPGTSLAPVTFNLTATSFRKMPTPRPSAPFRPAI